MDRSTERTRVLSARHRGIQQRGANPTRGAPPAAETRASTRCNFLFSVRAHDAEHSTRPGPPPTRRPHARSLAERFTSRVPRLTRPAPPCACWPRAPRKTPSACRASYPGAARSRPSPVSCRRRPCSRPRRRRPPSSPNTRPRTRWCSSLCSPGRSSGTRTRRTTGTSRRPARGGGRAPGRCEGREGWLRMRPTWTPGRCYPSGAARRVGPGARGGSAAGAFFADGAERRETVGDAPRRRRTRRRRRSAPRVRGGRRSRANAHPRGRTRESPSRGRARGSRRACRAKRRRAWGR